MAAGGYVTRAPPGRPRWRGARDEDCGGSMKVLVVGGGGREHALCWTLAASPLCHKLYCAPGNAGIAEDAECVAITAEDIDGLVAFVQKEAIDYVVVGPEGPLVLGLVRSEEHTSELQSLMRNSSAVFCLKKTKK